MEGNMTKKIDTTTIGGRIRKRRIDLGLSQEGLAEMLFTSKQMISSYENNKTELKVQIIKELAVALGTTSSFIIDGIVAVTYEEETAELVSLFDSINKVEVRKIAIEQLRLLTRINSQQ
jgi:transcriptional regulator with XRE-family HTH domain